MDKHATPHCIPSYCFIKGKLINFLNEYKLFYQVNYIKISIVPVDSILTTTT